MDWITNPSSEKDFNNIDWPISELSSTKKNDGSKDPEIESWAQPVKTLKYLLDKRCNIKGSLVFCLFHCPDGIKSFLEASHTQSGRVVIGSIHNTYNG